MKENKKKIMKLDEIIMKKKKNIQQGFLFERNFYSNSLKRSRVRLEQI